MMPVTRPPRCRACRRACSSRSSLLIAVRPLRYDNFLGAFNILTFLRYNSMFALIALGMASSS